MKVRNIFIVHLCLVLAFSLCGCGMPRIRLRERAKVSSSETDNLANSSTSVADSDKHPGGESSDSRAATSSTRTDSPKGPVPDSKEKTESDSRTESSEKTESSSDNGSSGKTESSAKTTPAAAQAPTIEKKVVFDSDNIVISTVDLKVSQEKYTSREIMNLTVSIENKNDYTVIVESISALLNNTLCVDVFNMATVWSGKKVMLNLEIDSDYYSPCGIEPIGDIKLKFDVSDENRDTLFRTDFVDIPTSLYDQMSTDAHLEGAIDLYNADGIKISGYFVESYGFGELCGVVMFVDNQTDFDISLDCWESAVNDTKMDLPMVFNKIVYAGTSAMTFLAVESPFAELQTIPPSEIEKLEFSIIMNDSFTRDRIVVTDPITLVKG